MSKGKCRDLWERGFCLSKCLAQVFFAQILQLFDTYDTCCIIIMDPEVRLENAVGFRFFSGKIAGWWLQVSASRRFNALHGKCPAVFWMLSQKCSTSITANIHPEFSSASRCFSSTKRSFPGFQTGFVFLAKKRVWAFPKKSFKAKVRCKRREAAWLPGVLFKAHLR